MTDRLQTVVLLGTLGALCSQSTVAQSKAEPIVVHPETRSDLGVVTGFHAMHHKRSKLSVRVIEADGSGSVAWNPIALWLVVTNGGTSDEVTRVWRLPFGVAKCERLTETQCGVRIAVRVDHVDDEGAVNGTDPAVVDVCFLGSDGSLLSDARVSRPDVSTAGSTKKPPN